MFAVRFLRPFRAPVAAAVSSSSVGTSPRFGKSDFFKAWIKLEATNSPELCSLTKSSFKLVALRKSFEYAQKVWDSECRFSVRNTVVCGVLGSIVLWPRISYCLEGFHPLADFPQTISTDSPSCEKVDGIIALIRKLLVPFFLILNLWLNWGQSHPVFLVAKVTLVFLTTKPYPSSVYLVVDRHQIIGRQPFLYRFKPPQLKTVEVEDYTFLCLARVEMKDEKLVLIGVLGGWWILPLSWRKEVVHFDKSSWKELVSLAKSRFRLAADTC
ncbi:uncharacterized protein [Primulina huaijiensis]|uniref:uncharacterized protein isoform X2 n=1 Tax=Primulina huaijiensis TaxID=1492673 RepID=UPI003CC7981A